ncbi:MAG: hypothetical protein ACI4SH_04465, partial [Candidatus Scatosoma sp.]
IEKFYEAFEKQWYSYNKPFGFDVQELRLGGLRLRTESCLKKLRKFAAGKTDKIDELDEDILPFTGEDTTNPIRLNDWKINATVHVM